MALINIPNGGYTSSWQNSASNNYNYSDSSSWGWSQGMTDGSTASAQSIQNAEAANRWNAEAMEKMMAYNAAEAQKNRDWQEMMSNTAYQRQIKDLTAAGINPILAAGTGGGAAVPSGGMATTTALSANMADAYTNSWNSSQNGSQGHSEGYGNSSGSGGSYGEYGIANQIESAVGLMSDAIGQIGSSTTGKKVGEIVENAGNWLKDNMFVNAKNTERLSSWIKDKIIGYSNSKLRGK